MATERFISYLHRVIGESPSLCRLIHFKQVVISAIRIAWFSYKYAMPIWNGLLVHNTTTAHVICPGHSVLHSLQIIDEKKSIILGCNLTALLPLPFDVLTVENGNASDYSDIQYICAQQVAKRSKAIITIKNLWMQDRFTPNEIERYASIACFLTEASVYLQQRLPTATLSKMLLSPLCGYYLQYKSSLFVLIALAANNGIKDIVLHGVDLGGKYFWEDSSLTNKHPGLPSSAVGPHESDCTRPKTEEILKEMVYILKPHGVKIYCASSKSGLSNFLPVYPNA